MLGDEKHWYSFSFVGEHGSYANIYGGYFDQCITKAKIEEARKNSGLPLEANAVLLSVSYLGYMSSDRFTEEY